jgi:hypothetical protein
MSRSSKFTELDAGLGQMADSARRLLATIGRVERELDEEKELAREDAITAMAACRLMLERTLALLAEMQTISADARLACKAVTLNQVVRRHPCYCCREPFPRDQLGYNRIWAGYNGRPKTGMVLMCDDCSAHADEYWQKQAEMQKLIAIVGLVITAALCLLFYAIRGY